MKLKVLILSNNRSDLLAHCLSALVRGLNGYSYTLVLVNHDDVIWRGRKVLCSYIDESDTHILSLEDDWLLSQPEGDWLGEAIQAVDQYPDIGLIRLRRAKDGQQPEKLTEERGNITIVKCWRSGWTSNPHLCRREVYDELLPVPEGVLHPNGFEQEWAKRYNFLGYSTAKLNGYRDQGVFVHIGNGRGQNV